MHDHDLDLIAEFASGFLTGADESRAAEFVRSCDRCAAEFEDQTNIRSLLAAAPAPALSEFERTSLRRSVLDTVAPPPRARMNWQRRFLAVTGVAAAVLVTAVGVGVVGQLGGSGGDDSFTVADGGESFATTTAASDMRVPPADSDDAAEADEEIGALAADEETVDDGAVAESAASSPNLLIDAGEFATQDELDSLLAEITALVADTTDVVAVEDAVAFGATCAVDVESQLLAVVIATIDDSPAQVFLSGDRLEPSVTFLAGADCAPLSS
ncbi:MAG: hypothetical protein WD990_01720 [Acidimicrobiia bacterium]